MLFRWPPVFCFDFNGNIQWKLKLKGGVRGAITISRDNYVIVPTLSGIIFKIDKFQGVILKRFSVGTKNRGLWTSIAITRENNLLFSVYKGENKGSIMYMNSNTGEVIWEIICGKVLSVPVIDRDGNLYFGTWDNDYLKYTF